MRKKRIFGPKKTSQHVRLLTYLLVTAVISAFSFSAGVYVGSTETAQISYSDLPQPVPRHLTF